MGVVYEARDPALGRAVAIKTIHLAFSVSEEQRKSFVQRFLAEARAAAALQHPNIVVVFDIGRDEAGTLYLALEHLPGETLEQILTRGPLEWRFAVDLARQLALGLHHAHQAGIVHRDVKPSNVMVLPSGLPKILDFGIAKLATAELTAAGQGFGTPAYMSPEQADGRPVDARSDIFSLGSVLFEMLSGRRAFEGRAAATVLMKVLRETPPPLRSLRPELPPGVEAVVGRALARDPAERPADAGELARQLAEALASDPSELAPGGTVIRHATPEDAAAVGESTVVASGVSMDTRESMRPGLALPPGKRVSLAVVSGPGSGSVFRMGSPRLTLGRAGEGAKAAVQLADAQVSRMHAVVQCDGQAFEVQDLGSTNGTFVSEERIQAAPLQPGAEFRVGGTTLLLIVADEA
jgi:serine/threonine-protein kinase